MSAKPVLVMQACPSREQLSQLLDEALSDADGASLVEHLEECSACQQALQDLAAGEGEWRQLLGVVADWPTPNLAAPVEPQPPAGLAKSPGRGLSPDEFVREYLSPADEPGFLGRFGHYHVAKIVGCGGMGVVLQAIDPVLHRTVAIKVMTPVIALEAQARQWFLDEARAAAAISHDHVVTIHAVEETPRGLPFLVMQYIVGESLQEHLDYQGALPVEQVLRIGAQVAEGLAAAHAHGLIHRDIKPGNILLESGTDRAKITDFGLARAIDSDGFRGLVAGTPQYMSPEQARGDRLDHRSDLYSLGSTLYAMCTGRPPLLSDPTTLLLKQAVKASPPPIKSLNPAVPDELIEVISRLTAEDPADRFQSAAEVAQVLRAQRARWMESVAAHMPAARRPWRWASVALACALVALVLSELLGATRIAATVLRLPITEKGPGEGVSPNDATEKSSEDADPPDEVGDDAPLAVGEVRRFVGHTAWISGLALSPDGKYAVSGGADKTVRLWEVATGRQLKRFDGHKSTVIGVAIARDGRRCASSGSRDKTIILWDLERRRELRRIEHHDVLLNVTFSPNGKNVLAGSDDGVVYVWDAETCEVIARFQKHPGFVHCVAMSADARFCISAGLDSNKNGASAIRLWNVANLGEVRQFHGHQGFVTAIAFSGDGSRVLSGSSDKTLRLWDTESGQELCCIEHPATIEGIAFLAGGHYAACGCRDQILRVWDLKTRTEVARFVGHKGPIHAIAMSPDEQFIFSAGDNSVRMWKLPELTRTP